MKEQVERAASKTVLGDTTFAVTGGSAVFQRWVAGDMCPIHGSDNVLEVGVEFWVGRDVVRDVLS